MSADRDYVLGTHDDEIARLGLQHNVWRSRALNAWVAAGFSTRQTLLDVGCGPGYAALDLAEIAGRDGRVVAVDRSRRFLDTLASNAAARMLTNIESFEADLDRDDLPAVSADGAWIRWVFAFVKQRKQLISKIADRIKRGGTIVIHEYFDYGTWRFAPRSEIFERFVAAVMESWRAEGGEPDAALELPSWLQSEGFEIVRMQPVVEVIRPDSFIWQWPSTFMDVGLARLVQLGRITDAEASRIAEDFRAREADKGSVMITPSVLEIIARRS